nr:MAG TPA: hypothetical protein [Bacteriophage sp.]
MASLFCYSKLKRLEPAAELSKFGESCECFETRTAFNR